ncbi:unnamed protein product [Durusdinium trenchii]|uniref:ABC transmembrane type-1 domain-containing protein n=1 Tax=Durusdinium trenchii TaxID=1381693 RepID=A0ABP0S6X1_9DINO
MLYKAWLMREFVTGQNLGRWREWMKALGKFPLAILASAMLSQTTKYMQARVSMLWRNAATSSLLRSYFSNMNYYKLQHHGTARIQDPDVRICSDVRQLLSSTCTCTCDISKAWAGLVSLIQQ